uniref:Uncharacterized protein n=1 Tax=Anguilla anguilla TaxID=7936 RepID=A0A0E9XMH9_ANGAN
MCHFSNTLSRLGSENRASKACLFLHPSLSNDVIRFASSQCSPHAFNIRFFTRSSLLCGCVLGINLPGPGTCERILICRYV